MTDHPWRGSRASSFRTDDKDELGDKKRRKLARMLNWLADKGIKIGENLDVDHGKHRSGSLT